MQKLKAGQRYRDLTCPARSEYILACMGTHMDSPLRFFRLINLKTGNRFIDRNDDPFNGRRDDFELIEEEKV